MSWVCSLFPSLSFSLSRPGTACLFFLTCSSLQLTLALLLCHTCSHFCLITFSLLLASVSPCSLSDYFVCTWVMPVCYAIYMNIYLVLSCLIKSRGVVLVLCAFVSQSSCCMWPRTRTVFLPYEKFQLAIYPQDRSLPLLKSLSTLCLFQFCLIARQTDCVYSSIKAITRTYLCTWILCFTWHYDFEWYSV